MAQQDVDLERAHPDELDQSLDENRQEKGLKVEE